MSEINTIQDLDILNPPSNIVLIGGEKIDLSFIPTGITFKVEKLISTINKIMININKLQKEREELKDEESLEENENKLDEENEKIFNYSIDLCTLFCSLKHPKLDRDWFLKETQPVQIRAIVDEIKKALEASYKAVEKYGKN